MNGGFNAVCDCRIYEFWTHFIVFWAVYSTFFTPLEFGFFRGLPRELLLWDIIGQAVFLADIVCLLLLAYRDPDTYRIVYSPTSIALRYLRSGFILDSLSCLPWDLIYKACGRKEEVRYLLWIRLCRLRKVTGFFHKMEKDIRINYLFTRIVKLIVVELYCTHTAACIFYYLATTIPQSEEHYTWIGSLKLGEYSFQNFREIDFWRRYLTSLYFAIVTMATVGTCCWNAEKSTKLYSLGAYEQNMFNILKDVVSMKLFERSSNSVSFLTVDVFVVVVEVVEEMGLHVQLLLNIPLYPRKVWIANAKYGSSRKVSRTA
ncbi:Potassium channel KOR1 [Platanthera zijinensis]|uniref:Potassium channel KOR1 n=1 Tax=Platanthera zijinensis TaxID=2320716 RepID=A0AAP0G0B4_9ASPA